MNQSPSTIRWILRTGMFWAGISWAGMMAAVLPPSVSAAEKWPAPDHYFGPDTVLFAEIDIRQIPMEKVKATLNALFKQSELQKYKVKFDPDKLLAPVYEKLDNYKPMLEFLRRTVADPTTLVGDRICIFLAVPEGGGALRVHGLIPVRDSKTVETVLEYLRPKFKKNRLQVYTDLHFVEDKGRTDSWLVFSPTGTPKAETWSPAVQKKLVAASSEIGDYPVKVVMIPNFALRDMTAALKAKHAEEQDNKIAMAGADIAERLLKSKWLGVWADVGNRPVIVLGDELDSEGDALLVELTYNNVFIPEMIKKAKEKDAKEKQKLAEKNKEYAPKITELELAQLVKEVAEMKRGDKRLSIRLETAELQRLTAGILAGFEDLIGGVAAGLVPSLGAEENPEEN